LNPPEMQGSEQTKAILRMVGPERV
jgi:hypothetical protein